jgi:Mlc titration factor MtfA (ptsG expression regulator)
MEAWVASGVLGAGVALAWLAPGWRLRRVLARPLDSALAAILERNVRQSVGMDAVLRRQLERLVQQFLYQKKFVGCAGLEVTDEMRVTIAGQACLLLVNRASGRGAAALYPGLHTVLVYPGAFLVPRREIDAAGVVTEHRQDLLGESWGDGRVVLSWEHVRRPGNEETGPPNVVLHEFAHQLDSESGSTNGAPYLGSRASYRSWSEVLSRDYANLRAEAFFGEHSVLDHYGATSPAEFFAVATESFFEQPWRLAARHPALYQEFTKYYRVDPREWLAEPLLAPEPLGTGVVYGQWQ